LLCPHILLLRQAMPSGQGDEAWDLDSDGDSQSEDSSNDCTAPSSKGFGKTGPKPDLKTFGKRKTSAALPVAKNVLSIQPPSMLCDDSESGSEDSSDATASRKPSFLQPQKSSAKQPLGASQLLTRLPPPEAAPKSAKGLVMYLRQENDWLRNALSQLQQEAEKTASQQASGEHATLDFAHLLELAREFGEGPPKGGHQDCDDWYGDDASTVGPATISMATPDSTPRGEPTCPSIELTRLQVELRESQAEIEQLKAQLAERDTELAGLRATHT